MRRQKIISMTDAHFEAASKMKNFSGWVREQLEKYIQDEVRAAKMTMTYVCGCGHEFARLPTRDRVRGLRHPPHRMCPECSKEATRWDLA